MDLFHQNYHVNNPVGTVALKTIIGLKGYREAKRIGIYLSMPTGEIQTDAIVRHALQSGKQVFVPYLHKSSNPLSNTPKSVMEMVDLSSLSDYLSLKRDSWGIPTIGADTVDQREHILDDPNRKSEALDMILMPGVAFDTDADNNFIRRLGHGKGFYDYFLHRYVHDRPSNGSEASNGVGINVLLYGLALKEQALVDAPDFSVPVGEHDHFLHGLVVGDGRLIESPLLDSRCTNRSE